MPIPPVLEAVFQGLPDGVCLSDGGRVVYVNPAARRLLGLREGEADEAVICDALCGRLAVAGRAECASDCPLRDAADPREAVSFRGRHESPPVFQWREADIRRLAKRRDLRVRCLRLPGTSPGGREGLHLTFIEDAAAETELEARKEDWRGMVVHDLRAPLANVFAALRALQDGDAPRGEALDIATRNCRRVMGLLDDYLDLAKFDAGASAGPLVDTDLDVVARAAVEETSYLARERGLEVETAFPPGLRARADAGLLARVLQNLLHNACKFAVEGGVVRVRTEAVGDDRVAVSVGNTGSVITAEELPSLFKRFSRGAAGRAGRGSGLGLAFCREALHAMGGEIAAASGEDWGVVFTVVLPRAED